MAVDRAAREQGKMVYYPRVEQTDLVYYEATPSELVGGGFGVREPRNGLPALPPARPGVLYLVPGMAFDPRGTRLGSGAGHYDRTLRGLPGTRIGVIPAACLVERLPRDAWDVAMHAIVTENGELSVEGPVASEMGDEQWT